MAANNLHAHDERSQLKCKSHWDSENYVVLTNHSLYCLILWEVQKRAYDTFCLYIVLNLEKQRGRH